jgi:hypothetical protein
MPRVIKYQVAANRFQEISVDQFPSYCGICHKNIDPLYIGCAFKNEDLTSLQMQAAFQCTNLECNSVIIGYYSRKSHPGTFILNRSGPITPKDRTFNEEIEEVSPNFVKIFNQSFHAEQQGLTLISGIGYRKALEFLIKDYLIYLDNEKEEEVLKKPLSQCINELENSNIKEMAKRAAWLGNDEAHYTRKWEDKDVNDLKKLIDVTVYFISMDVASKKYLKEMA